MTVCGICGGTDLKPLFEAADINFHTTDDVFTIARCRGCGVAQTIPRMAEEELGRHYPSRYYPTVVLDAAQYERSIGRYQKDKVRILKRYRQSGKILDIGCGAGYFLHEAGEAGFDPEGVEFSREAAAFGRNHWDLRIADGDALSADLAEESFDIVTMWQVLEHLPKAAATLARVRTLLRPGGLLVAAVPNFGSWQAGIFKGRWYHLDVPRHQFHFDTRALRHLLEQQGFRVRGVDYRSPEHNWAGIMGSLMEFSPSHISIAGRAMRRFLLRPLARLAARVEEVMGKGGTVTICAEKV
jgi:2-polyprenyl-3-methyl-5-hydroxy-6-metoxy-1,4-benzoquinol methylase